MYLLLIAALVLVGATFTGNDKANFNCEGSVNNENSSLYLRLVLFTWWNPVSFFRGDFFQGRTGNAFVTVNQGEPRPWDGVRVGYKLEERHPHLVIKNYENATYGTMLFLDTRQQLTGILEGHDADMRCFVAHSLYWF